MLTTPAPFPEVGSWALHDRDGETVAARIISLSPDRSVAGISYPDRPTASGAAQVEIGKLLDPSPLTDAEKREMEGLAAYLNGLACPRQGRKATRFQELWLRCHRLELLVEQLAQANRIRTRATGATREAHRIFSSGLAASPLKVAA